MNDHWVIRIVGRNQWVNPDRRPLLVNSTVDAKVYPSEGDAYLWAKNLGLTVEYTVECTNPA